MMDKTIEGVEKLADEELKMANEQHPLFASNHEGAAVILEEVEEAALELEVLKSAYKLLWGDVKSDNAIGVRRSAEKVRWRAIKCAAECIQVAAMCQKMRMSEEKRNA